jgi:hypothetical protein
MYCPEEGDCINRSGRAGDCLEAPKPQQKKKLLWGAISWNEDTSIDGAWLQGYPDDRVHDPTYCEAYKEISQDKGKKAQCKKNLGFKVTAQGGGDEKTPATKFPKQVGKDTRGFVCW